MPAFRPQNSPGLLDGPERARQSAVSAESSQVAELACFSTENPIGLEKNGFGGELTTSSHVPGSWGRGERAL